MTKQELKQQNAELAEMLAAIRDRIDDKLEELGELAADGDVDVDVDVDEEDEDDDDDEDDEEDEAD